MRFVLDLLLKFISQQKQIKMMSKQIFTCLYIGVVMTVFCTTTTRCNAEVIIFKGSDADVMKITKQANCQCKNENYEAKKAGVTVRDVQDQDKSSTVSTALALRRRTRRQRDPVSTVLASGLRMKAVVEEEENPLLNDGGSSSSYQGNALENETADNNIAVSENDSSTSTGNATAAAAAEGKYDYCYEAIATIVVPKRVKLVAVAILIFVTCSALDPERFYLSSDIVLKTLLGWIPVGTTWYVADRLAADQIDIERGNPLISGLEWEDIMIGMETERTNVLNTARISLFLSFCIGCIVSLVQLALSRQKNVV